MLNFLPFSHPFINYFRYYRVIYPIIRDNPLPVTTARTTSAAAQDLMMATLTTDF